MGPANLLILQLCAVLYAPVGEGNDVIRIRRRLLDGLEETVIIVAPEDPWLRIRRLRCVDGIFGAGRGDIGDPETVGFQIDGLTGLRQVTAGTDIGDLRILQGLQRIQEGYLSKVKGMVVGEANDIHPQILQIRDVVRITAEGPGLAGQGLAAPAVDKFIVDPHQVHASHDLDKTRIDAVGYVL